ncbi:MAG: hypothetical protein GX414_08065 [Acidobacteria bacterium]|nr:hypothetical protein [Acidobacteriota bacterium]
MAFMQLLNQHSAMVFGGLVFGGWALTLALRRARRAHWATFGAALLAVAGTWLLLRPHSGGGAVPLDVAGGAAPLGQPVLVEVFSDL